MTTLHEIWAAKPADESWWHYANRLGRDARFEGVKLADNPFPTEGFLWETWRNAWNKTNLQLTEIDDGMGRTYRPGVILAIKD